MDGWEERNKKCGERITQELFVVKELATVYHQTHLKMNELVLVCCLLCSTIEERENKEGESRDRERGFLNPTDRPCPPLSIVYRGIPFFWNIFFFLFLRLLSLATWNKDLSSRIQPRSSRTSWRIQSGSRSCLLVRIRCAVRT